jgi:hypothetical protein
LSWSIDMFKNLVLGLCLTIAACGGLSALGLIAYRLQPAAFTPDPASVRAWQAHAR